jgi:hypothetical protein
MKPLNVLVPDDLRDAVNDYCARTLAPTGRPLSVGEFMRRAAWEKLDRLDGPRPPRVIREYDEVIRKRGAQR